MTPDLEGHIYTEMQQLHTHYAGPLDIQMETNV